MTQDNKPGTPAGSQPGARVDPDMAIDLEMVRGIMGDDSEQATDYLMALFLRTFPGCLTQLEMTIADGLPSAVEDAAHSAKGVAANAAALPLQKLLIDLETAARDCRMDDVKEYLQQVQRETDRVISFIRARSSDEQGK